MAEPARTFGPYVLLEPLASGSRGDVYLARPADPSRNLPCPVVLKRLHRGLDEAGDFTRRFVHEASLAVAIESPYVARVFDTGRVGDTYFIAFEHLPGWPLSRVIRDLQEAGSRPSLTSIVDIASDALAGLEALHTATVPDSQAALGIVHRDVAPKNIMVGEDGRTRLIDLGLGKSSIQDWKTGTGVVMGTPGYMAPEQVMGQAVDARTDLYAMGIVLWEMLTLQRFVKKGPVPLMLRAQLQPERSAPSELRGDVPAALDAVVLRALAAEPAARFTSAAEMKAALRDAVGAAPAREDGPPVVNTLVGDLLWGELQQAKTDVTKLLDLTPSEPMRPPEPIEIIATRAAPHPLAPPVVELAPGAASPTPLPYAAPLGSGPLPTTRPGVPLKMVVGLMLLTLAVGIGLGALLLQQRSAPTVAIESHNEATPAPVAPAAVPGAAPSAAPRIEAQPAPELAAEPAPAKPARRPPRRARRAPEPAPEAPKASVPDAASLLRRVMAVRPLLTGDAAARAARLATDLQAEASSPSPAQARLRELARQVRRLEAEAGATP